MIRSDLRIFIVRKEISYREILVFPAAVIKLPFLTLSAVQDAIVATLERRSVNVDHFREKAGLPGSRMCQTDRYTRSA